MHATVEFVDIAGLQRGASEGEGLGNRFLGGIREVDAILYVLRAFVDDDVLGGTDPLDDLHTLEFELTLADLASVEQQLERQRKAAKGDKSLAGEVAALEWAVATLADGTPLYRADLTDDDAPALRPFFLLTNEAGAGGGERRRGPARRRRARRRRSRPSSATPARCSACACSSRRRRRSFEADERAELLEASGSARARCRASHARAYHLLGLRTFLTTGDKESRAWTFRAGAKAPECAGRHPLRPQAGVHPGRGDPLGRAARARLVDQGQGGRASSASRARTTRSPTATSSRSASTCRGIG